MRKIILKVHDLEFENNPESVEKTRLDTIELLKSKAYKFDGMLISVKDKVAHVWKNVKYVKPTPPTKARA
jgi:hypothetical protein